MHSHQFNPETSIPVHQPYHCTTLETKGEQARNHSHTSTYSISRDEARRRGYASMVVVRGSSRLLESNSNSQQHCHVSLCDSDSLGHWCFI